MTKSAQKDDSACTGEAGTAAVVSTRGLESTESRHRWAETLDSTYCELDVGWPKKSDQFTAELALRPDGDLSVSGVRADPHAVIRTPAMVTSDANDDYMLCLITRGSAVIRQGERSAVLEHGSFGIVDASAPFVIDALTEFEQVVVRSPRRLLAARLAAVDQVTAQGISGSLGIGGFVSRFLIDMATADTGMSALSSVSVAASAVDLIATAINEQTSPLGVTKRIHHEDLRTVQRTMERYLHDPDHTIAEIGVELGMSVRYIHKLFSGAGTTPRSWWYQVRLERARKQLLETGLTATEISERVGFRDVSHFSRAFRRHFGASPAHYRMHHRGRTPRRAQDWSHSANQTCEQ